MAAKISLLVRALNRVDLPTFGRPTIPIDRLIIPLFYQSMTMVVRGAISLAMSSFKITYREYTLHICIKVLLYRQCVDVMRYMQHSVSKTDAICLANWLSMIHNPLTTSLARRGLSPKG
ncbi:hypothetical protein D3C85_825490 [compost metagenome]